MNATEGGHRPAILGPVLLAAVFLAVIGGSVGWVLGSNVDDGGGGNGHQSQQTGGGRPGALDGGSVSNGGDGGNGGDTGGQPQGGDELRSDRCPRHMIELARGSGASGDLSVVFYLYTGTSEVWICADSHDRLFYQGHRIGSAGEALVEGSNALFLTDVVRDGERYVATNTSGGHSTRYCVSRNELVVENASGTQTEPAVAPPG